MAGSGSLLSVAALLSVGLLVEATSPVPTSGRHFSQQDLNYCNRYAGPILVQAHLKDKADFSAANEIFQQVNATCSQNLQNRIQPCSQCTFNTCKAKITHECRQYHSGSFWSYISGRLSGNLVQGLIGINSVLEGAVAGTIINIGGFIKNVGSFLTGDVSGQSFTQCDDFYPPRLSLSLKNQFGLGDWFARDFLGFWKTGAGVINSVATGISGIFGANCATAWQNNVGVGIGDAAINILGSLGNAAGNLIGGVVGGAGHVIDGAGQAMAHLIGGLFGGVHGSGHLSVGGTGGLHGGGLVGGVVAGAGELVGGVLNGAGAIVNGVGTAAGDILGGLGGALTGGAGLNINLGGNLGGDAGINVGIGGHHGGGLVENAVNAVGHVAGGALKGAGSVVEGVGSAISSFSGFRKRSMEKRDFEGISIVGPETEPKEPTCNQLSTAEMAAENCVYYQKQCTACRYDFNTVCPGYQDTLSGYKTLATLYYRWKNVNFEIKEIVGMKAIVDIFGGRYSLNLPAGLDMSNYQAVGATCALEAYALSTSMELNAGGSGQVGTGGVGSTGGHSSSYSYSYSYGQPKPQN